MDFELEAAMLLLMTDDGTFEAPHLPSSLSHWQKNIHLLQARRHCPGGPHIFSVTGTSTNGFAGPPSSSKGLPAQRGHLR